MVIKDTPLTYVFDLDGVIYRGMELMPSARETLATLRKNGNNVWFFTNNAALSRKSYVEKLAKLDIPSTTNQIMTSAYATALHMEEIGAVGKTAYMIGGEGIKEELELIGMKVLADDEEPDAKIDYVVVGIDRAISYNKIARAQQSIFDGAEFIATNADASYPSDGGKILPGAGCMVAAVDPNKKYKWLLFDGWWQSLDLNTAASGSFRNTETKEVKIYKTPEEIAIFQYNKDTEQLSFKQLSKMVAIFKRNPDAVDPTYAREVEVNKWNKLSLPLSSLIFAILAAPLAVKPQRSSSSVGLGLSILVIFIYYMVWHYTASLSTQGTLPPIVGSFLADVIGIGASIMLLKKAYK